MIALLLATPILVMLAAAPPGERGGDARDAARRAKHAFEEGSRHFKAEAYSLALPHFREAYELSRRPSATLALAQCERMLGMYDEALEHYREYVATDPPDAPTVLNTMQLVEELRSNRTPEVAAPKSASSGGPPATAAPDPAPRIESPPRVEVAVPTERSVFETVLESPYFWSLTGTGAALLAAGGVTGVLTLGAESELESKCMSGICPSELEGTASRGRALTQVTNILWIAGSVTAISGVVLPFVLGPGTSGDRVAGSIVASPNGVAALARVPF